MRYFWFIALVYVAAIRGQPVDTGGSGGMALVLTLVSASTSPSTAATTTFGVQPAVVAPVAPVKGSAPPAAITTTTLSGKGPATPPVSVSSLVNSVQPAPKYDSLNNRFPLSNGVNNQFTGRKESPQIGINKPLVKPIKEGDSYRMMVIGMPNGNGRFRQVNYDDWPQPSAPTTTGGKSDDINDFLTYFMNNPVTTQSGKPTPQIDVRPLNSYSDHDNDDYWTQPGATDADAPYRSHSYDYDPYQTQPSMTKDYDPYDDRMRKYGQHVNDYNSDDYYNYNDQPSSPTSPYEPSKTTTPPTKNDYDPYDDLMRKYGEHVNDYNSDDYYNAQPSTPSTTSPSTPSTPAKTTTQPAKSPSTLMNRVAEPGKFTPTSPKAIVVNKDNVDILLPEDQSPVIIAKKNRQNSEQTVPAK